MKPALVDISVLLLFHARADNFSQVWQEVRRARPARLFLYQDGPRMVDKQGETVSDWHQSKDYEGIKACRELVSDENIDWKCEVHRKYLEQNQGCDPSGYLSQQWAFSQTDKCIVLEDDVVPSQSFFTFCKEMLDRYEHDERITMIAGFNTDEVTPSDESYFFTRVFSIWGWASWSRVIKNLDGDYGFVKDKQRFATLCEKVRKYKQRSDMPQMALQHTASGIQYFESIFWAYMLLHDGLAIMPQVNMINNVGMSCGTHYSTQLDLMPKDLRRTFTMRRLDISFPLVHPDKVEERTDYQERHYKRMAWNNPLQKVRYSLEELWLNLKHGNISNITKAISNRLGKTLSNATRNNNVG